MDLRQGRFSGTIGILAASTPGWGQDKGVGRVGVRCGIGALIGEIEGNPVTY